MAFAFWLYHFFSETFTYLPSNFWNLEPRCGKDKMTHILIRLGSEIGSQGGWFQIGLFVYSNRCTMYFIVGGKMTTRLTKNVVRE